MISQKKSNSRFTSFSNKSLFLFFGLLLILFLIWKSYTRVPPATDLPGLVLSRLYINQDTPKALRCRVEKDCVHVVMAANREYLAALLASTNSMELNSKRAIALHVLIGPGDRDFFEWTLREWLSIPVEIVEFNDERVKPLIKVWDGLRFHKNTLNYARFYLPMIFPHLSRIVYIDPDTIVRVDIGELSDKLDQHPHNLHYLAAVPANLLTFMRSSYAYILSCRDPDIASFVNCADDFFNAGVFVTDLERWREENITGQSERWMALNTQKKLWKWGSQPPLNLVFYRKWSRLESEWNFRDTGRDNFDPEMIKFVKIIHFTGKSKPWTIRGEKYWQWWCQYYPRKHELWFCQPQGIKALYPSSQLDYSFVRKTIHEGLRENGVSI
eukprot:TRINITY_DN7475_c0_g1_i1.p1 TRINITY_DN7475_c0_g1~~TRINITY_DN7475_c0_g1_i1.p1  ORF type:complete len:384 (-),score=39.48 TRINITY_DN7475_c0_g1_i1:817-1968(-)